MWKIHPYYFCFIIYVSVFPNKNTITLLWKSNKPKEKQTASFWIWTWNPIYYKGLRSTSTECTKIKFHSFLFLLWLLQNVKITILIIFYFQGSHGTLLSIRPESWSHYCILTTMYHLSLIDLLCACISILIFINSPSLWSGSCWILSHLLHICGYPATD